jgi:hypothetical protein
MEDIRSTGLYLLPSRVNSTTLWNALCICSLILKLLHPLFSPPSEFIERKQTPRAPTLPSSIACSCPSCCRLHLPSLEWLYHRCAPLSSSSASPLPFFDIALFVIHSSFVFFPITDLRSLADVSSSFTASILCPSQITIRFVRVCEMPSTI